MLGMSHFDETRNRCPYTVTDEAGIGKSRCAGS